MITISQVTEAGVKRIAANMQRAHREECEGAGMSALEALQWSVNDAALTEMAVCDGEPIAVWGLNPTTIIGSYATVWMLGTDEIPRHPLVVCKVARRFISAASARYRVLECFTDLRYHTGCEWAKWLGFHEVNRVTTATTIYAVYRRT